MTVKLTKRNARAFALANGWRDNEPGKYVKDDVGVIEHSKSGWWWFYPVDGAAAYRAGTLEFALHRVDEHAAKKAVRP